MLLADFGILRSLESEKRPTLRPVDLREPLGASSDCPGGESEVSLVA